MEELKLSWPLCCWDQLEYQKESWRAENTCYCSDFSENHQWCEKLAKRIIIIIIIIIIMIIITWTWLRKGNFKRETESLLMAAQNSAIRTNHIKARIDKNSKCRLYGDRDEMISYIINECSKLGQKEYKARPDWVGKVIHWEMCKKFKFDHAKKWHRHNPAPLLENDTHKLLWYFDIQMDHLISARRPDFIITNKKKKICKIVDFAVPAE